MYRILIFLMGFAALCSCEKDDLSPGLPDDPLPLEARMELLRLCDTASLLQFEQFEHRIHRIQDIFAEYRDPRGAFPTVYKAITHLAVSSLNDGAYQDPVYSERFALDFSKRYFVYLERALRGEPLDEHWKIYYDHAAAGAHMTRLVLEGINAHLTIDLTMALAETGVQPEFEEDWILFGDIIVQSVPDFLDELMLDYGTDASDAFGVFWIGDFLDALFGEGATVNWGFNLLRIDAFRHALLWQDPERQDAIEYRLLEHFRDRAALIALLDGFGMTPRLDSTRIPPE